MNPEQDNRHSRESGVTNPEIARQLDLSDSAVSRIRSGNRYPSLDVMRKMEAAYSWPVAEQLELIPGGGQHDMRYAHELERRVLKAQRPTENNK